MNKTKHHALLENTALKALVERYRNEAKDKQRVINLFLAAGRDMQKKLDELQAEKARLTEELAKKRARRPEDFEWWGKVCYPEGMTAEQVQNELADFDFMIDQVPKVYMEVTGGLLSKPNYYAEEVISAFNNHVEGLVEEALRDAESEKELLGEKLGESHETK